MVAPMMGQVSGALFESAFICEICGYTPNWLRIFRHASPVCFVSWLSEKRRLAWLRGCQAEENLPANLKEMTLNCPRDRTPIWSGFSTRNLHLNLCLRGLDSP